MHQREKNTSQNTIIATGHIFLLNKAITPENKTPLVLSPITSIPIMGNKFAGKIK